MSSSSSARRVCTTIQRRATRTLPRYSRAASAQAHSEHHGHQDHHGAPHPWTYPAETFTSRPIIYTTAAFAFLVGLNAFGLFDVNEKHPITQYMTDKIASNESILQENLDHIEVVKEEAADYRLRMSAKLDTFKPIKNTGLIAMGSPHGIAVKPREDMTDIKTRPYRNQ